MSAVRRNNKIMKDKISLSVILHGSLCPAVSQPGVDHGPRQLAFSPLCLMTPGLLSRFVELRY